MHLEVHGRPAAGKTVTVESSRFIFPPEFIMSSVYESKASMRDTDATRTKNVPRIHPEYGAMGEHESLSDRAVDLSRMSESWSMSKTIQITEDGKRVMQDSVQFHSWSRVVATNIPSSDEAMRSRTLRMMMQPLETSGKCFGEAVAADEENKNLLSPVAECFRRALHFFTRCVAAFCVLVNAGVVDLPPNSLNVAIINRLMPNTTDASNSRLYKQLYKLGRVFDIWMAVHQFLASPVSPLTLVHNDRLSLEALVDVRVLLRPQCTTGLFLASCTPFLGEDLVLRRVAEALLRSVFLPSQSHITNAKREYQRRRRAIQAEEHDTRQRELKLRHLLLEMLPRLFPAPPSASDAARPVEGVGVGSNSGGGAAAAVAAAVAASTRVYFTLDSLSTGGGGGGGGSGGGLADADGAPGARPLVDTLDDAFDAPAHGPTYSRAGAAAAARLPGQDVSRLPDFFRASAAAAAAPAGGRLELLHDDNYERTLQKLIGELRQRMQGDWLGLPSTGGGGGGNSSASSRANAASRRANGGVGESAADHALRESIRSVLTRLQVRLYTNGWVSLEVRGLDYDDNARVLRETEALVREYDVPKGTYVLYPLANPRGAPAAEAFQTLEVPGGDGRRDFAELLDLDRGRTTALQKLAVALRLAAGAGGDVPHVPEVRPLRAADWRRDAERFLREASGVGLAHAQQAVLVRAARVVSPESREPRSSILDLVASGLRDARVPLATSQNLEALATSLAAAQVGAWAPGMVYSGAPRSYHDVEADPHDRHAAAAAAEAEAAAAVAAAAPAASPRRRGSKRPVPSDNEDEPPEPLSVALGLMRRPAAAAAAAAPKERDDALADFFNDEPAPVEEELE